MISSKTFPTVVCGSLSQATCRNKLLASFPRAMDDSYICHHIEQEYVEPILFYFFIFVTHNMHQYVFFSHLVLHNFSLSDYSQSR
jgi:hypothetical protein